MAAATLITGSVYRVKWLTPDTARLTRSVTKYICS